MGTYTSSPVCLQCAVRSSQQSETTTWPRPATRRRGGYLSSRGCSAQLVPLLQLASTDQGQHLFRPLPGLPPALPHQQLG